MPTYEYLCQACSHRFETWQKMTDDPLTTCPKCGEHIRRVLYPAGIVFKGHGFYKTDHGNGALPATNKSESTSESKSESTSESKSESTSAPKSESSSTSTVSTK
jgi:putative FmdB family regulatory protein